MKASDRGIIFGVLLVALAVGFYMLVLAPKRDQAGKLQGQIDDLNASIAQQQQVADFGEQARKEFPRYYGRLVVLGKAVPARADTSSMLVQLNSIANRSKIGIDSVVLTGGGSDSSSTTSTAPSRTPTTPTPPSSSAPTSGTGAAASTTSTPAPATEASAALQPLGAVVGSAGLPTLPYDLGLKGSFFDIANFIGGLDGLVTPNKAATAVSPDGRLFTVDAFTLSGSGSGPSPSLDATFMVTTYVTPEDQGLTAGASPSGPAPASPGVTETQPASAAVAQ
jgi:Tfp pilus assembly protein PilO